MPILDLDTIKDNKKLTLSGFQRRYKENPNDPELQEYKESLQRLNEQVSQYLQTSLKPYLNLSESVGNSLKQIAVTMNTNIYGELFKAINETISSSLPKIMYVPPTPNFGSKSLVGLLGYKDSEDTEPNISDTNGLYDSLYELPRIPEFDLEDDKEQLVNHYPNDNKKFKTPRKILQMLAKQNRVEIYHLAKATKRWRTLRRGDYNSKATKTEVQEDVENVIRGIRKNIKKHGYLIFIRSGFVELVEIRS